MHQAYLVSLKEEVEKMKETSKRLREHDWEEELELIYPILLKSFNSLLTHP